MFPVLGVIVTVISVNCDKTVSCKPAFIVWRYDLTLRRLMSYIYMKHPFLMFLDHTQRRSTVGRTPLDE